VLDGLRPEAAPNEPHQGVERRPRLRRDDHQRQPARDAEHALADERSRRGRGRARKEARIDDQARARADGVVRVEQRVHAREVAVPAVVPQHERAVRGRRPGVEAREHTVGERLRAVGGRVGDLGARAQPLGGRRRAHERARHRERFQHLVLDAARDAQRRDRDRRVREVRAHVRHAARDDHTVARGERLHRIGRVAADDRETHVRAPMAKRGQHLFGEPGHGLDVRPVVHRASECEHRAAGRVRARRRARGVEVLGVDAVLVVRDAVRALGRERLKEIGLGRRHEQGRVERRGHPALVGEQRARLPRVHPRARAARASRVLRPLVGVDVDEVGDAHQARVARRVDVLRHRRAVHDDRVDALAGDRLVDPALHRRVAVVRQRQRLAARQPAQARDAAQPRIDRAQVRAGAQPLDLARVAQVVRVVDERAEEHAVAPRQVAQQVVRPDLVALVGRIRDPVRQQQDVASHRSPK